MLTCKSCNDWELCKVAAGVDAGSPACNSFNGELDKCLIIESESDVEKRIETLEGTVAGLEWLVESMQRRWDKVMAAIVREANE